MKRFSQTLMVAALCVIVISESSSSAQAGCHGRSGGFSSRRSMGGNFAIGHSITHSQHKYTHHSSYRHPHNYPVYSTPQPTYVPSQPVYQAAPPMPADSAFPQAAGFPQTGGFPQTAQMPQSQQIAGIGGGLPAGGQLQTGQLPTAQPQAPAMQANPAQVAQAPSAQPQAGGSAEMSALQALGGFAPPQAQPQTPPAVVAPQQPNFVGTWMAQLGNGARVQLVLQADGTFSWTATNASGSSSAFQGSYQVQNGSLSLTRGTDSQRLAGTMNMNGNDTFSFQLSEGNAAALQFARS